MTRTRSKGAPDAAGHDLERLRGLHDLELLREMLSRLEASQLVDLAVALESDNRRLRAELSKAWVEAQGLRDKELAKRRSGARKTNDNLHADAQHFRRIVYEAWEQWRAAPLEHPAGGKGRKADFLRWLETHPEGVAPDEWTVEDIKTVDRWIREWEERARHMAAWRAWADVELAKKPEATRVAYLEYVESLKNPQR